LVVCVKGTNESSGQRQIGQSPMQSCRSLQSLSIYSACLFVGLELCTDAMGLGNENATPVFNGFNVTELFVAF